MSRGSFAQTIMPQERKKIGFRGEANASEKQPNAPEKPTRVGFGAARPDQSVPRVPEDGKLRVPGIGRDLAYRVRSGMQALEEEQRRFLGEFSEIKEESEVRLLINAAAGEVFGAHRGILVALRERYGTGDKESHAGEWMLLMDSVLANFQKEVQEEVDLFDEKQKTRAAFEHDLKQIQAEANRQYGFIADRLERCP